MTVGVVVVILSIILYSFDPTPKDTLGVRRVEMNVKGSEVRARESLREQVL